MEGTKSLFLDIANGSFFANFLYILSKEYFYYYNVFMCNYSHISKAKWRGSTEKKITEMDKDFKKGLKFRGVLKDFSFFSDR